MENGVILIADTSDDFIDVLSLELRHDYRILVSRDGNQAYRLLQEHHPDVLVLDLILPGMDGLTLLHKIRQEGICPMVLAGTRFLSDYVTDSVSALGVDYLMIKPCDIGAAVSRIRDLMRSRNSQDPAPTADPRISISNLLLQMGFSTKRRGYGILREAILIFSRDTSQSITKELYPAVVAQCGGTTIYQVEHSIRAAIKDAWQHRDNRLWQLYFPPDDTGVIPCPTNTAFISRFAVPLSLDGNAHQNSFL